MFNVTSAKNLGTWQQIAMPRVARARKGKEKGCSVIPAMALGISQVIARCVNRGGSSARLVIEAWPSGRQLDVSID